MYRPEIRQHARLHSIDTSLCLAAFILLIEIIVVLNTLVLTLLGPGAALTLIRRSMS